MAIDDQATRNFNGLIEVLSRLRSTLRSLTFLDQDPWSKDIVSIQSLAPFTKLERFSSDVVLLLNDTEVRAPPERFPISIREIRLVDPLSTISYCAGGDLYSALDAFADAKLTQLPNLAKVDLVLDQDDFRDEDAFSFESFSRNGLQQPVSFLLQFCTFFFSCFVAPWRDSTPSVSRTD
jgi:hypothetical protein